MASVITVGPASRNENSRAIMSAEWSRRALTMPLTPLPTAGDLKKVFQEVRTASDNIFAIITKQPVTSEQEFMSVHYPEVAAQVRGRLPRIDPLLANLSLRASADLTACVVFVQTSIDNPWEYALSIVGSDDLEYYSIFDPTKGEVSTCKSVYGDLKEKLEAVTAGGLYYHAFFLKKKAPTPVAKMEPAPVVAKEEKKKEEVVVVKKEKEEEKKEEKKEKKEEKKEEEKKEEVAKKKVVTQSRKRGPSAPTPAGVEEPAEKKPALTMEEALAKETQK